MNQPAKTIGVFFGSRSPEHDISILTAERVLAGLRALPQYRTVPIYISRAGEWFCGEALSRIELFREPQFESRLRPFAVPVLSLGGGTLGLHRGRRGFWRKKQQPVRLDIAFPCFHGSFGEDGTVQGLFEIAGVPYVGCGVLASAITMSKVHTRRILRDARIPTMLTHEVSKESFERNRSAAMAELDGVWPYPLFVKPNALGSSISVARVANAKELEWALEVAFQFDTLALVEPAIPAVKEVNVAVIGHRELTVSETEEPQFESAFQTFEEKYLIKGGTISQSKGAKGNAKSNIPADIPEKTAAALKDAAEKAFRAFNCSGISRFDFFINTETNEWHLGEVNTLPGSLQAHLWEASGIALTQLIEKLIGFAEERHREQAGLTHVFGSSVLQK